MKLGALAQQDHPQQFTSSSSPTGYSRDRQESSQLQDEPPLSNRSSEAFLLRDSDDQQNTQTDDAYCSLAERNDSETALSRSSSTTKISDALARPSPPDTTGGQHDKQFGDARAGRRASRCKRLKLDQVAEGKTRILRKAPKQDRRPFTTLSKLESGAVVRQGGDLMETVGQASAEMYSPTPQEWTHLSSTA